MTDRDKTIREIFAAGPFTRPSAVPGGYPRELFVPVDVPALGAFLKTAALELYRRHGGSLPTTAYVFGRCNPWPDEAGEGDTLLMSYLKDGYGETGHHIRDAFAFLIKATAQVSHAHAVAVLMEAWVVERRADGSPLPTSIANEPDRREILMVSLETSTTRTTWTSEITRDALGVGLAPFVQMPAGVNFDGRFFGLMP